MMPNSFYTKFAVYDTKGGIDIKKSAKAFEEALVEWGKSQNDLKPAILAELKKYPRLGGGKLITFVIHALELEPIKENVERVQSALDELVAAGKLTYHATESGKKRGRGTGYSLPKAA